MTWRQRLYAILVVAISTWPHVAFATDGKRVALVIGNAAYTQGPLANPVNDAEAVANALEELGFSKIIRISNATKARMETALTDLAAASVGAEMAVVYFAGHGTERDGRNYLIPIDAKLERASDLDLQAIGLPTVVDQIGAATKLKLVILDACRNNVFPLAGNKRSTSRGLARVEPDDNTLVAYAAKDGTVAADGNGARHSPFTGSLLKHITTPGLEIRFLLAEVRDDVLNATNRQQQPHIYGSLGREHIYLKAAARGDVPALVTQNPPISVAIPRAADAAAWAVIRETTDPLALRKFIEQFPGSSMRKQAEDRLREIQRVKQEPPSKAATQPTPDVKKQATKSENGKVAGRTSDAAGLSCSELVRRAVSAEDGGKLDAARNFYRQYASRCN